MTEPQPDLERLERWMQTVITHPRGVRAGIASDEAQRQIETWVDQIEQMLKRSTALTAIERLAIYNRSYFARLQECLRAEFPVLLHALGEDLFNRFTFDYLKHYPARSYTLNRLGENFPRYLAQTRPDAGAPPDQRESWPEFIIDLATIERAFSEVFNGPGVEREPTVETAPWLLSPARQLREMRCVPVVCLKLLAFRYPVVAYFNAVRRKGNPALPGPAENFLAITRRDYVVTFYELSRPKYDLLTHLMNGETLAQAIAATTERTGLPRELYDAVALDWLQDWIANGFFRN